MAPYPQFRGDLAISCQQTADGAVYVIKEPRSERFFRLREHEYLVARQLDGATDLESIRRDAEARLGAAVHREAILGFVKQLDELHLLERASGQPASVTPAAKVWRGNPLYLRFNAVDPDRFLSRAVVPLRFLFTPGFVMVAAAVIATGIGIVTANSDQIWLDLRRLYRLDVLPLAWLTVLSVTALHELAHGMTCKYFGGQVREMGLMLLYFQPAMYCNVSDAWLFPEKSRRLWVTFAGGYFEAFLWALAAIAWRTTEPGTLVSAVALIVIATSGLKFAFNANPLIKLDGYYLLSDWLSVPNLRQRSFAFLRARVFAGPAPALEATPRERRIYVVYGLLAGIYSGWLLGWLSWHIGGYLIGQYQAAGLAVFVFFLGVVFRNAMVRVMTGIGDAVRRARLVPNAPRSRRSAYVLAAAAIAAVALVVPVELRVNGSFAVLPAHNADVRAEVDGLIAEIYVEEGDAVRKGQALARLSDQNHRAELAAVDSAIREKRARLNLLRAGPRPEEVALARTEVSTAATRRRFAEERYAEAVRLQAARRTSAELAAKAAEDRLAYARTDLERSNELFRLGLVSRSQIDERQQQARLMQNELDRAREALTLATSGDAAQLRQEAAVFAKEAEQTEGRLRVLMAGSRQEEIEATEAEVAQLEARRTFLDGQLAMTRITSPAAGVVVTPRLKEKVGQHVGRGDLVAEVFELRTVTAEIAISEKDIADVRVGAPASFKARAYPERTFAGSVAAIAPAAIADELAARVFRVRVDIDNAGGALKPAMTGTAKIAAGRRSLFTVLTRRAARLVRVEFWTWW